MTIYAISTGEKNLLLISKKEKALHYTWYSEKNKIYNLFMKKLFRVQIEVGNC